MAAEYSFNVLEHSLVPEHHLLAPEEAEKVLEDFNIERRQLPKIRKSDPVVKVLESIHGQIPEGSIVKVVRRSETAGEITVYRLVTRG